VGKSLDRANFVNHYLPEERFPANQCITLASDSSFLWRLRLSLITLCLLESHLATIQTPYLDILGIPPLGN
jgi:hypothetical protein